MTDLDKQRPVKEIGQAPPEHSEEHYRSLFAQNPGGMYSLDPKGKFVAVNPAMGGLTGYDVRRPHRGGGPPEDLGGGAGGASRAQSVRAALAIRRRDGSVEEHGQGVYAEDGEVLASSLRSAQLKDHPAADRILREQC